MKQWAALVGDVVGSRTVPDRRRLQEGMTQALAGLGGLAMTIGDEFQGRYQTVGEAIDASLLVHLGTRHLTLVRIGIGWGEVSVETTSGLLGQDGPAWWRARDAIEVLAGPSGAGRTAIDTGTSWDEILNAYLTLRDSVTADWDDVDVEIATALLDDDTQRRVANRLDLHPSSVSRRVHGHKIAPVVEQMPLGLTLP